MEIIYVFLSIITILLIVNIILTLKAGKNDLGAELNEIKFSINTVTQNLKDTEANLKNEFTINRKESADTATGLRTEIGTQLNSFTQTFAEQLVNLTSSNEIKLEAIRKTIEEKLLAFQTGIDTNSKESRKELKENLEAFQTNLNGALKDYKERLREQFGEFEKNQRTQNVANSEKLGDIKSTLEKSVKSLQDSNETKLEEMRKTVDEKLQTTLETRLAQSFTLVSERLETVHKGLGEMQQLAIGVGDLKKVLSNVKTRGILGEIQLSNILEQVLAPEQYEINWITKKGTNNRVEFAIKIPQQNQDNKILLMPIDSKFPIEDYYSLLAAYEASDNVAADAAGRALESAIKKAARDIHDKYIDPPDTSEIGLLFLPVEGLYAEVVRRPALMETLQREYQIIVTGPTTLSAILNTISFGYRTMALEQRSGEIKRVLQAVKTEFKLFGEVLNAAQRKILNAHDDIDKLVGTRTRQIQRKLKDFEELPGSEAGLLLGDSAAEITEE